MRVLGTKVRKIKPTICLRICELKLLANLLHSASFQVALLFNLATDASIFSSLISSVIHSPSGAISPKACSTAP